jgi:hypothetical protein
LATGSEAFAQGFSVTITVDENGHGLITNTNGFMQGVPGTLVQDPGPGGLAGALTYNLLGPPVLTAGDLILQEDGPGGAASDIIRFNPQQNLGSLVFYSDNADAGRDLADIGFPTALYANNLTRTEVGPEGNNGFTYTPTLGQPGAVTDANGVLITVHYVLISDAAVPEPGPMALSAVAGVIGLVAVRLRRKRAAA